MNRTVLVAREEVRQLWRDRRLPVVIGTVGLLLAASSVVGWQAQEADARDRDRAEQAQRDLWLTQQDRNPHGAAHDGLLAIRPAPPLGSVDRGVDSYAGTVIAMQAHGSQHARLRPAVDAPSLWRFGEVTPATIVQVVLPLALILLGFGTYASERDRGTLQMLLATGASPGSIALGKLAALGGITGGLALLVLAVPMITAIRVPGWDGGETASALVLGAVYGLYLITVTAGVLTVSALSRTSRGALATLLAVWAALTLVTPRISAAASVRAAPTVTMGEFGSRVATGLADGIDGHAPWSERAREFEAEVLELYGVGSVDELPVNFDGLLLQADEEYTNEVYGQHTGDLWDGWLRQERLHLVLAGGNPVVAVRTLSSAVSGTGLAQHAHFTAQAEQYRQELMQLLNHDMTVNSRSGDWDYRAGPELWAAVEAFRYQPPALGAVLRSQGPALGAVFLWALGALVAAGVSVRTAGARP